MRADCNDKPDDGCETHTFTDAKNCGACGHDCLGGECKFGQCQPVPLSIGQAQPIELTQDGVNLYWAAGDNVVRAMPLGGGDARTLAVSTDFVTDIATDGEYVYWITGNFLAGMPTVQRAKVDGADAGSSELVYQGVISGPVVEVMTAVAADSQNVYWSLFDRNTGGAAYFKRAKNGGAAQRVVPDSGYAGRAVTATMQVSGNAIYAGGSSGLLLKMATDGSSFERLIDGPTDGGTTARVASIAVLGDTVYFTRVVDVDFFGPYPDGLYSIPAAGGSPKTLDDKGMWGLVVDSANVYYATQVDVVQRPTGNGRPHPIAANHPGVEIVADSHAIYWAEVGGPPTVDGGAASESIWMLAK